MLDARQLPQARAALLRYYRRHRRDLPWRRTRDPYRIWVSEIMLQQTQVDTVVPRYAQFLKRFPTIAALAAATEEEVCEAWAGLGYYRRARNLHRAAQELTTRSLPQTAAEWRTLPGIGRYTSGAIASIAQGEAAPILDGNVIRVLCRIYAITESPYGGPTERRLWALAETWAQGEAPGDLNQALMELGATVCTPQGPACLMCPLRAVCQGFASGDPAQYPIPKPRVVKRQLPVAFAWIATDAGVWLRRRPLDGLWAGLWELPSAEGRGARRRLNETVGGTLVGPWLTCRHELTHRHVEAKVYQVRRPGPLQASTELRPFLEPLSAPLSALARKVIRGALQACTKTS